MSVRRQTLWGHWRYKTDKRPMWEILSRYLDAFRAFNEAIDIERAEIAEIDLTLSIGQIDGLLRVGFLTDPAK